MKKYIEPVSMTIAVLLMFAVVIAAALENEQAIQYIAGAIIGQCLITFTGIMALSWIQARDD